MDERTSSPLPYGGRQEDGDSGGHTSKRSAISNDGSSADLAPEVPDLRAFADQLSAIAEKLREECMSGRPAARTDEAGGAGSAGSGGNLKALSLAAMARHPDIRQRRRAFAEMARLAYSTRRRRAAIFGNPELFGEPAWDILLDLYIADAEGKPVSVSSACIGSASPPTTGLRWLGVLAEHGLVLREHDPADQRRVLVRLTASGLTAMDEYFATAGSAD